MGCKNVDVPSLPDTGTHDEEEVEDEEEEEVSDEEEEEEEEGEEEVDEEDDADSDGGLSDIEYELEHFDEYDQFQRDLNNLMYHPYIIVSNE